MTTFVLLTGAGFTRNWGGPLVSEVFHHLIASPDINDRVRMRLWSAEDRGGYETLLDELQLSNDPESKADLRVLEAGLRGMFNSMRYLMQRQQLDFATDLDVSLTKFLSRFDALFTLNQDVFVETHYHQPLGGRWDGFGIPGVKVYRQEDPPWYVRGDLANPPPRVQPYFKLHGSMNFFTSGDGTGLPMMIVGGRKAEAIAREPLLAWYLSKFRDYLSRPDARLMVIGYSFSDPHINAVIEGAAKNGLKLFVIDPRGARSLDKRDHSVAIKQPKSSQQEVLEASVIGLSSRPLAEIFGGRDLIEFQHVMGFFG